MLKMKEIFAVLSLCNIAFGNALSISEAKISDVITENNINANVTTMLEDKKYNLALEDTLDSLQENHTVRSNDTPITDYKKTMDKLHLNAVNENITNEKILQEFDSKKDNKVDERSFLLIKSQKHRWPKVHHLHHNPEISEPIVQLNPYRNNLDSLASASSYYFFRRPRKQKLQELPSFSLLVDDPFKELTHHMNEEQKKDGDKQRTDYHEGNQYELVNSANLYAPIPIAMPPSEHARKYLNSRINNHNQYYPRYAIYPPSVENVHHRPALREPPSKKREDLEVENSLDRISMDNTDDIDLLNKYLNSAIESRELLDKDPTKIPSRGNKKICDCRSHNVDDVGGLSKRDDIGSQFYANSGYLCNQGKCKSHFYDRDNDGFQQNLHNEDVRTSTVRNSYQSHQSILFKMNYS